MDKMLAAVTNAICFEMFKDDGRPVLNPDTPNAQIDCTEEEVARGRRAAERVLKELGDV